MCHFHFSLKLHLFTAALIPAVFTTATTVWKVSFTQNTTDSGGLTAHPGAGLWITDFQPLNTIPNKTYTIDFERILQAGTKY